MVTSRLCKTSPPLLRLLTIVAVVSTVRQCAAKTFKLGVLMPFTGDRALGHLTAGAVTLAVDELNHDTRWSVLREQGHNFTFMWRDTESRMDKGLHEFVDLWASSLECSLTCNVTDSCADIENCQIDAFIGKYCTHVAACS